MSTWTTIPEVELDSPALKGTAAAAPPKPPACRPADPYRDLIQVWVSELLAPKYHASRRQRLSGFLLGTFTQHRSTPLRSPRWYRTTEPPDPAPKVSIVTPSFNQGVFLERTILSVLEQSYPNIEYVVQDGGSRDESVEILSAYGDRLSSWESRPDDGQGDAVNIGFERTTGEIMAYLNSDDVLLPGSLAYVAKFFQEHPEVDVVYGHRVVLDAYDGEIGRWVLPPHDDDVLRWADYVPQETMFWRRRLWRAVGGIDPSFPFALDWDLLVRFQEVGARFARLPRFLGGFRFHSSQKSLLQLATVGARDCQRILKRCHGRYVTCVEIHRAIRGYLLRAAAWHQMYRCGLLPH